MGRNVDRSATRAANDEWNARGLRRRSSDYLKRHWAKKRGGLVRADANLTTPEDESTWTLNYRVPDLVLVDAARRHIDRNTYLVGAPLVVVEIANPGDETYDKFPFYANLVVPEIWVIHRDSRTPEIHVLGSDGKYTSTTNDPSGWWRSPVTSIEFRQTRPGKVWARINGDEATAAELPED